MNQNILLSTCIGSILEWYDFSVYAYLTPILAMVFFPNQQSYLANLLSYTLFASAYLIRPIGAIFFGHLGDTQGRKKPLIISIGAMAITTCCIGLLPTYHSIGILAPCLLLLLRLMQGLFIGGESFGALCFISELKTTRRIGYITALVWASSGVGMLFGSVIIFCFTIFLKKHDLYTFGWRIPFLLGALTGIVGYYIRRNAAESAQFLALKRAQSIERWPLKKIVLSHKVLCVQLASIYLLSALITYLLFVFMPVYASTILNYSLQQATAVNTVILILSITLNISFGFLSDIWDKKQLMLCAAFAFVILSFPLYHLLAYKQFFFTAQLLFTLLAACFQGPLTALVIAQIPTEIRYSLGSLSYNLSYALFGGTAPLVALFLIHSTGNAAAPGAYLAIAAVITSLGLISLDQKANLTKKLLINQIT